MLTVLNYAASRLLLEVALFALLVSLVPPVDARTQARDSPSAVVAIVARSGKLLPLASLRGGGFVMLPWPLRPFSSTPDERLPSIPRRLSDIPSAWFAPLALLPSARQNSKVKH